MTDITLRPWTMEDLAKLVNYANNPNIAGNLTDAFPFPYTRADGAAFIETVSRDNPLKVFAIETGARPVGSIGVFPQSGIHRMNAEMGYWLAEPYWGKGIMVKAVKEILKYAFRTFDIRRVFARPFGSNRASQRVLEKSGFIFEARFEKTLIKSGEYLDEYVYGFRKDQLHSR